ncbi:hypothetical protein SD457_16805 [Coprobacillaceae bacterium CR2/5/TPMF4]|nr:hypothetical protein SD457_16805 [Coprobacillaceae bacterium CR2/5/TPMF4]
MIASIQPFFSVEWFVEMIGFIAVGVICDALSQVVGYYYSKLRFRKRIKAAMEMKSEIAKAINEDGSTLVQQSIPTYSSKEVVARYLNDESHLAFISFDGGEYVNSFDYLPPITYAVEVQNEKAEKLLEERSIKVTKLTKEGKLPFKDERIDVLADELANYDKYDLYRVVKPGGYIIVNQLGSDNYKELTSIFLPFKLRGRWDLEAGKQTLSEIGLEIVDSFEEHGFIRFDTLASFVQFLKGITRVDVTQERFMNFYSQVLQQIKEKSYFELTTHRFLVVARKRTLEETHSFFFFMKMSIII